MSAPPLTAELSFKSYPEKLPKLKALDALEGQASFRQALIDYSGDGCTVTGLNFIAVLRARHAKL